MERKIVQTADGSKTIQLTQWGEQYHSMHGALQEAYHVFIRQGLQQFSNREVNLLEIGFGTGLNALVTLREAPGRQLSVRYTALEAYPVVEEEWKELDYADLLDEKQEAKHHFEQLHLAPWGEDYPITPSFTLHKLKIDIRDFKSDPAFDLVYFDAFGARVQPELWTDAIFQGMYQALRPAGCLVTYSAKGSVRRAMQKAGFGVERLPGPPGKREMLRAFKPH
ncbi:MAG: tRNA (5-methylaminomethyl-2-thiouridine)(34)-methyltransferase MnmD [Robiginitalea sp.]|jgi:tRNA U34 5-methylaminomethyl-2-thiouridine-forming methyltransferase MnmC